MEQEFSDIYLAARARAPDRLDSTRSLLLSQEPCDPAAGWAATLSHADVPIDRAPRIQLLDQLAAIAELNPVQIGDLRSFEADWRGMPLRVETVVTADLATVVARAELADYLVPVIPEVDGPMPRDREELTGTPPRLEVPAVFCVAPVDDAEVQALVHLETTELIRENRPRWVPRFVHTDCRSFMFLLARSFFTDCLGSFDG